MNSETLSTYMYKKCYTINNIEMIIRIIENDNMIYFVAKDVAKCLGYKNTKKAINAHINKRDCYMIKDLNSKIKLQPHTKIINIDGVNRLLTKSRLILSEELLEILKDYGISIKINTRYECKESTTLGQIYRSLKCLHPVFQKKCGKYYIDMYIPVYCIVIECDELGHKDRNPEYEINRHNFLVKEFGKNNIIRYNPDSKEFNVFDVINDIFNIVNNK